MQYLYLAETLDKLESTRSRLKMVSILSNLFRSVNKNELRDIVYLLQGKIHPNFCPQIFGMADKLILKTISSAFGLDENSIELLWIKTGDVGKVVEEIIYRKKQMTLFSEELSLSRVIDELIRMENTKGRDSQNKKMKILANMLYDSHPIEAKYLCRTVTGKMRVGIGDTIILDAIAEAFATKEDRPIIERAFNISCDAGLIAETMAIGGIDSIQKIEVNINNPVKAMLAERLPSIEMIIKRMGNSCAMEYKYDGIRIQAHINGNNTRLYSRNLEDITSNFPDVARALINKCKLDDAIIDGECVAIDMNTGHILPFQTITRRKRKHMMDSIVNNIPVSIFMFDILYANGHDMTNEPYLVRRNKLESSFEFSNIIQIATMSIIKDISQGCSFFASAIDSKCEGVIAKSISKESIYRAGSRGFIWIKYKKDYQKTLMDSFDLTVIGAFYGMGKRVGKYGALLMAAYNSEKMMFETVCKLGTGFDDAFLNYLPELLNEFISRDKPKIVNAVIIPNVWFYPKVVLEVISADITLSPIHTTAMNSVGYGLGLGIRFPRFTGRVRYDKDPDQSTTVKEIINMYEMRKNKINISYDG